MNNKPINVLKPNYRIDECLDAIRECLECGWTGLGFKTLEFEEAWKQYTGLPHAHFLNSGTSALHIAIRILKDAYGWEDGDEIITTPLTFVSTNHAIRYERLFPVFADVNSYNLCLNPDEVEKKITTRTRAVMYVGVGGLTGHLREMRELCKKHNLKLILDAAHMAGTKIMHGGDYVHVGQEADVATFSFHTVKNLPTADGGMVCFQDPEFDAKARKLSWLGIDKNTFMRSNQEGDYKWKYDVPEIGFKYHGNSIMAAIGLVQLKYLDEDNAKREEVFQGYKRLLDKHNQTINLVNELRSRSQPSRHLSQIIVPNRDIVIQAMNRMDIFPGVHYVDNTHYRMYRYAMNTCPVAHELSNKLLTLPTHTFITEEDIGRVVQSLEMTLGL